MLGLTYYTREYEKDWESAQTYADYNKFPKFPRDDNGNAIKPVHMKRIQVIAVESIRNEVSNKAGYYFCGDFILWTYPDGTTALAPQVVGMMSKMNYQNQSGWIHAYHNGNLRMMIGFHTGLEGYKPITEEQKDILKDNINQLQEVYQEVAV